MDLAELLRAFGRRVTQGGQDAIRRNVDEPIDEARRQREMAAKMAALQQVRAAAMQPHVQALQAPAAEPVISPEVARSRDAALAAVVNKQLEDQAKAKQQEEPEDEE